MFLLSVRLIHMLMLMLQILNFIIHTDSINLPWQKEDSSYFFKKKTPFVLKTEDIELILATFIVYILNKFQNR